MRASVFYFTVTGSIGGAIGFGLMEIVRLLSADPEGGASSSVLDAGWLFAAFGLAVGAALGATAGWYFRQRRLLLRGMVAGGLLGLVGGFLGGLFGQWIYNRVPIEYVSDSRADIAVVLDSSGSMGGMFMGNDPWGKRLKASKQLIARLSANDRIAVVDFDDVGRLVFPLTQLASDDVRRQAEAAVDSVDDAGGTNLDAGLSVAIEELIRARQQDRPQTIIFLTDGAGEYSEATAAAAHRADITIHTVGLGSGIDPQVLQGIASATGGRYFGVAQASGLIDTFEKIRVEAAGSMAGQRVSHTPGEKQKTNPLWLSLARLLAWGAMGLVLGLGQGFRDNSWQDLKSCSLGGALGGLIGGALIEGFQLDSGGSGGIWGRLLADVLVGALIGGTLRLIKNASEARLVAAKIEKKAVFGGLAVGDGKKGAKLGAW